MIFECKVLCFKAGNENLGQKDEDIWLPLAIDLNSIFAIKKNGGEDSDNNKKAVVWHKAGDYFVVDINYEAMVKVWKDFKATEK